MRVSAALVLFLLAALPLEAQAPTSFREGVIAFEKKDWAAAEKLMRQAVAGNPNETEGTVSISGSWFETYVPHYFLARALARQGKCEEALVEFAESERQGVTPTISDFAKHLKTRDGCRKGAKEEKPKREIGVVEVPFGEDVPPPATTTRPPAIEVTTTTTAKPPQTKGALTQAQALRETRNRLSAAVTAYLRGRYEETARLLSEPFGADRVAAAEAALFRAAARDAMYRIGGGTDDALAREVERDLRTYRQLRPDGRPDARIFPPHFIEMAAAR